MPSEMRPLQRHLERLGHRVSVPLLPGHGGTHQKLLATRWQDWVAGARRAADALVEETGTALVGGLSMGALLAVLIAADDARIGGVALLSPTLRYDGPSIPWTRRLLPLAHVIPFSGRTFYWREKPPYGLRDARLQRLVERAVKAAERGESTDYGLFRTYVGSIIELNRLARAVRRRAVDVRCPALVLHSREDTVTTGRNAEEMLSRLGSREKVIHWLSGCDHMLTLDLKRREVAETVGRFFARIDRRGRFGTDHAPRLEEPARSA